MASRPSKSLSQPGKKAGLRKEKSSLSSAPDSTRDRILAYLQEHPTTTALELAQSWGLTRADIRYHLGELKKDGLIESLPRDPDAAATRGRPIQRYRLSTRLSPPPLTSLCQAALDLLLESQAPDERKKWMEALASRLARNYTPSENLTQRLNQAIRHLTQANYQARWEAHALGPHIVFRNCPYAAILPAFPELCLMDHFLLNQLLHIPLRQTTKINFQTGNPSICTFML